LQAYIFLHAIAWHSTNSRLQNSPKQLQLEAPKIVCILTCTVFYCSCSWSH